VATIFEYVAVTFFTSIKTYKTCFPPDFVVRLRRVCVVYASYSSIVEKNGPVLHTRAFDTALLRVFYFITRNRRIFFTHAPTTGARSTEPQRIISAFIIPTKRETRLVTNTPKFFAYIAGADIVSNTGAVVTFRPSPFVFSLALCARWPESHKRRCFGQRTCHRLFARKSAVKTYDNKRDDIRASGGNAHSTIVFVVGDLFSSPSTILPGYT